MQKENIVKQSEPKDYIVMNMKMKFGNEILEYTAKFSPNTNTGVYEGKDAKRFLELSKTYQESISIFTSKDEFTFYKNKNDYFTNIASKKPNNRIAQSNNIAIMQPIQLIGTTIEFFRNSGYNDLLRTFDVSNAIVNGNSIDEAPHLQFTFYKPKNDGTANYEPTQYVYYTPGVKAAYLGYDNDRYSSLRIITNSNFTITANTNNVPVNYQNFELVCFQNTNYGGKALGFTKQNTINPNIEVNNLQAYFFGSTGIFQTNTSWNGTVSSYWAFYY